MAKKHKTKAVTAPPDGCPDRARDIDDVLAWISRGGCPHDGRLTDRLSAAGCYRLAFGV
jgi:hypothetical protein